jgi:ubiquinone biosynthesis protein UbiJ
MFPPLDAAFAASLNHVLAGAPWAQARLAPHAGKTIALRVFPFDRRLTITADGRVTPAPRSSEADMVMIMTPPIALRMLAGDEAARQQAIIEGDTALASEVAYLAQHLRWDFEEDLSKVFGDVVAHRVGQTARDLNAWGVQAGRNLAENFRDYWVAERPLLAPRIAVEQFNRDVDRLRDDVERLEKRVAKLTDP